MSGTLVLYTFSVSNNTTDSRIGESVYVSEIEDGTGQSFLQIQTDILGIYKIGTHLEDSAHPGEDTE
jgi:hypothetical protein